MTIATTGVPRGPLLPPALSRPLRAMLVMAMVAAVPVFLIRPITLTHCYTSRPAVARATAQKYAFEAHGEWSQATGLVCPAHLAQLSAYTNHRDTRDPWGTEYLMRCGALRAPGALPGIVVVSAGEDRRFGTLDDIRSDR